MPPASPSSGPKRLGDGQPRALWSESPRSGPASSGRGPETGTRVVARC
jgi:hypothetical protein